LLHGSLFDVKCSGFFCKYRETDNYTDPIVPALEIPTAADEIGFDPTTNEAKAARELDISDENVVLPEISFKDLPRCPTCRRGFLRPGVVWFGETLPKQVMDDVENWMAESTKIDLILVIGTSAKVYPAAGYVDLARAKGARVAVINMDREDTPASGLREDDWFFEGDAAQIVPEILKSVIGELRPEDMVDQAEGRT
jgi:NAD-dependent deacetylase sirtuin 5